MSPNACKYLKIKPYFYIEIDKWYFERAPLFSSIYFYLLFFFLSEEGKQHSNIYLTLQPHSSCCYSNVNKNKQKKKEKRLYGLWSFITFHLDCVVLV